MVYPRFGGHIEKPRCWVLTKGVRLELIVKNSLSPIRCWLTVLSHTRCMVVFGWEENSRCQTETSMYSTWLLEGGTGCPSA